MQIPSDAELRLRTMERMVALYLKNKEIGMSEKEARGKRQEASGASAVKPPLSCRTSPPNTAGADIQGGGLSAIEQRRRSRYVRCVSCNSLFPSYRDRDKAVCHACRVDACGNDAVALSVEKYDWIYKGREVSDARLIGHENDYKISGWADVKASWVVWRMDEYNKLVFGNDPESIFTRNVVSDYLTVPEMQALMMLNGWYLPEFRIAVNEIFMMDDDLRKQVEDRCEAVLHPDYSLVMKSASDVRVALTLSLDPEMGKGRVRLPLSVEDKFFFVHELSVAGEGGGGK